MHAIIKNYRKLARRRVKRTIYALNLNTVKDKSKDDTWMLLALSLSDVHNAPGNCDVSLAT